MVMTKRARSYGFRILRVSARSCSDPPFSPRQLVVSCGNRVYWDPRRSPEIYSGDPPAAAKCRGVDSRLPIVGVETDGTLLPELELPGRYVADYPLALLARPNRPLWLGPTTVAMPPTSWEGPILLESRGALTSAPAKMTTCSFPLGAAA